MVGADDPAAVLHARLARYIDTVTTTRTVHAQPRYILGLIPHIDDQFDSAMAAAINERIDAIQQRADRLLAQAQAARESWLAGLGTRPTEPHTAKQWDELALAITAYRDAWTVITKTALGDPTTLTQYQDATRIRLLTHHVLTYRRHDIISGVNRRLDRSI